MLKSAESSETNSLKRSKGQQNPWSHQLMYICPCAQWMAETSCRDTTKPTSGSSHQHRNPPRTSVYICSFLECFFNKIQISMEAHLKNHAMVNHNWHKKSNLWSQNYEILTILTFSCYNYEIPNNNEIKIMTY